MTPEDRQQTIDIVNLAIHKYFDHYLTDTFPAQMDRLFDHHNSDTDAHPAPFQALTQTSGRVNRAVWMLAGGSAVIGVIIGGIKLAEILF